MFFIFVKMITFAIRNKTQKKMKTGIHPDNYRLVAVKDMSIGETFITKSCADTKETITIDGTEYP